MYNGVYITCIKFYCLNSESDCNTTKTIFLCTKLFKYQNDKSYLRDWHIFLINLTFNTFKHFDDSKYNTDKKIIYFYAKLLQL